MHQDASLSHNYSTIDQTECFNLSLSTEFHNRDLTGCINVATIDNRPWTLDFEISIHVHIFLISAMKIKLFVMQLKI